MDAPAAAPAPKPSENVALSGGKDGPPAVAATYANGGFKLVAASPGAWGNDVSVTLAAGSDDKTYTLTIALNETFDGKSFDQGSADYLGTALEKSRLVRLAPAFIDGALTQGTDGGPLGSAVLRGDPSARTGLYALQNVDVFNLLCIPPASVPLGTAGAANADIDPGVLLAAAQLCADRRAMLILDPPQAWAGKVHQNQTAQLSPSEFDFDVPQRENAAVYFPRIVKTDPVDAIDKVFPACGAIAGQIASTDLSRGVWKAPAGIATALAGVKSLEVKLSDGENGILNPLGINCLRTFPILGTVIWGARTLDGADAEQSDYKYVNVRRLTLFIEESLVRGTKWAVFEPNDETLWSSLRTGIGSFMADLSRQGAFYDYQVLCDKSTTTPRDIELGVVNVIVAFAPVKPAEFVVLKIQQEAGPAAS